MSHGKCLLLSLCLTELEWRREEEAVVTGGPSSLHHRRITSLQGWKLRSVQITGLRSIIIPSSYQLPCDYSFIQTLISWRKPADMEDITNKPNTILSQSSTYTSAISRAKIKTIKLTTVVIVCYILSSTPFIIGQIIAVFGPAQMARKMGKQMGIYS